MCECVGLHGGLSLALPFADRCQFTYMSLVWCGNRMSQCNSDNTFQRCVTSHFVIRIFINYHFGSPDTFTGSARFWHESAGSCKFIFAFLYFSLRFLIKFSLSSFSLIFHMAARMDGNEICRSRLSAVGLVSLFLQNSVVIKPLRNVRFITPS